MGRMTYWVQYLDMWWKVRHHTNTVSTHLVKAEAVEAAKRMAEAAAPSELIVCTADGAVEGKLVIG